MLHLIAAVCQNGGIGKDNDLLCHLSADLKYPSVQATMPKADF